MAGNLGDGTAYSAVALLAARGHRPSINVRISPEDLARLQCSTVH